VKEKYQSEDIGVHVKVMLYLMGMGAGKKELAASAYKT
jgi:hypothetical protein